ncbi:hypothetical protein JTB14_023862 [Gonioctena quinquepunctata]|nr:hypothetical protein JTB14_023862 [Gonioctena quinquepunctata]
MASSKTSLSSASCKTLSLVDPKTSETREKVSTGIYITAFCSGVYEVLEGYRNETIKLENAYLQNPNLSLTCILSSLEKFRSLFQVLLSMIQVIQDDSVHGCLIIGRLHKYVTCGVDQIGEAADRIIRSINHVFYRHLCNWIIYGDLVDTLGEFFITDGKTADDNFLYPEQLMDLSSNNIKNLELIIARQNVIARNIVTEKVINQFDQDKYLKLISEARWDSVLLSNDSTEAWTAFKEILMSIMRASHENLLK